MSADRLHEQGFNYALAQILRECNARWRENEYVDCERVAGGERPDIEINDPRIANVVIECAWGGDNGKDARARIESGLCDTAIAVSIPMGFVEMGEEEVKDELRRGGILGYSLLQRDGEDIFQFPSSGYIEGKVSDLASLVLSASVPKRVVERVADEVAELINEGARALASGLSDKDKEDIAKRVHQRGDKATFRTVMVLWLDAMLVQSHLRFHGKEVADPLPIEHVQVDNLVKSWRRILEYNWYSIFAPAVDILEYVGSRSRQSTSKALRLLLQAISIIEDGRLGDSVNIGGELFPKMSVDRKNAAAYYTTPATAELLCTLLIKESDRNDWHDKNLFERLSVGDLACGTGTLLRTMFRRIRRFHESAGSDSKSLSTLHVGAMERGVCGVDISPIAAHLTNSGMVLAGFGGSYTRTRMGWVSVGAPAEKGLTIGSLEFLVTGQLRDLFSDLGGAVGGDVDRDEPIMVLDRTLDYVVMNPPYSRTAGGIRGVFDIAGLNEKQRKLCQKRWTHLLKNENANKNAGMAASFLCLARKKVKLRGKIGFVLPLTAAFSEAWGKTRQMIVRDFKDIVVVTRVGSVAGKEAMSADTGMGEMLLIASLRNRHSKDNSEICCVSLNRMPNRLGEAGEFGRSITRAIDGMKYGSNPIMIGNDEVGQVSRMEISSNEPWSDLGVLNTQTSAFSKKLVSESVLLDITGSHEEIDLGMPMVKMKEVFAIGPTHDLIGHPADSRSKRGGFTLYPVSRKIDTKIGVRSLWQANWQEQNRLVVEPTHKGVKWSAIADRIISKRGWIHYARGIQWTSQSLLVATTEDDVLGGSAWTTLFHEDERLRKAFALWANSILGFIVNWTQGSRTQMGRGRVQVKAIQIMPCPNFRLLSDDKLDLASRMFDELKDLALRPACQAHADENRKRIDRAVIEMLGLDVARVEKILSALRNSWCCEPSIHGYNRTALNLLGERGLI